MTERDVAVVGGGMFGVTAAVDLAREGYDVELFEKKDDILTGASGSNHWRLHRGYHYPQSDETAKQALETEPLFRDRYADAVITNEDHYYAIAEGSWVDYAEYQSFMEAHGLEFEPVDLGLVNESNIEQTIQVNENHVSPEKLRELCWNEIEDAGVTARLNSEVKSLDELQRFDSVVIATYANINSILPEGHELRRDFKFEVCEVPIVKLPERYLGNNIIVVYGPYMSTDHWGDTDFFAMGDYHNMRHYTSTGYEPEIPDRFRDLVNAGLIEDPQLSNFTEFREHGEDYIPGVADAELVGSLFTIRTILPDVEDTDARPTLVDRSGRVVTVFGGKLATSVDTAQAVVSAIREKE